MLPPAEKPTRILLVSNCPETKQDLSRLHLLAKSCLIERRDLELLISDSCESARVFLANGCYDTGRRVCDDPPELIIFDLAVSSLNCIQELCFDLKLLNRFNTARKKITAVCLSVPIGPHPPKFCTSEGIDAFHPKTFSRVELIGLYIWLGAQIKKHYRERRLRDQLRMDHILRTADVKVRTYFC